jgi:hypothetical protein
MFGETLVKDRVDIAEELFALLPVCLNRGTDLTPANRINVAKRQIFKFTAKFSHTETVGEGGIDVECLSSDGLLALRLQMFQRAHVVKTVGKFDEHNADIGNHGEEHLSDVLCLTILAIGELDFVDFGDAINDVGDLFAEGCSNFTAGHGGIFDGIVEKAGCDGGGVELHLGQDPGYLKWMQGKGIARRAFLAGMMLQAKFVSLLNDGDVVAGTILPHGRKQHLEGFSELLLVGIGGCRSGVRGDHN